MPQQLVRADSPFVLGGSSLKRLSGARVGLDVGF
jgi:hypothetical protein